MERNLGLFIGFFYSLFLMACTSDSLEDNAFDCSQTDLSISLTNSSAVSSCAVNDGSISVQATGGQSPYTFSINGGGFQSNASFNNLGAGTYTIEVKDANGCIKTLSPSATIANPSTDLNATIEKTADNVCVGGNGSFTINATGGTPPYSYKIGSGLFTENNVFQLLENGNYTLVIKDAENCQVSFNQSIERAATGLSYTNEIKNIINASCNLSQCHGGGRQPNLTTYANVNTNKTTIKSVLLNNSMPNSPGTITSENRQKIICWIDDGALNN